eukprot:TRINITY_DN4928_c0_g1_i2.p1 TRINITY_DN4928_c0_g1~~TRINITY_DN4928_c0_g1_i2.p1  ORF type:complete len:589 (+),score=143.47 TRINITY_DN4928_c0_g1_i2:70-1767(+)
MANWWEAPPPGGADYGACGASDGIEARYNRIASSASLGSQCPPAPDGGAPLGSTALSSWLAGGAAAAAGGPPAAAAAEAERVRMLEELLRKEQRRSAELELRLRSAAQWAPPTAGPGLMPSPHGGALPEAGGGAEAAERARHRVAELEGKMGRLLQNMSPEARAPPAGAAVCRALPSLSPESPSSEPTPRAPAAGADGDAAHRAATAAAAATQAASGAARWPAGASGDSAGSPPPVAAPPPDTSRWEGDGKSPSPLSPLSPTEALGGCCGAAERRLGPHGPPTDAEGDRLLYRPPTGRPPRATAGASVSPRQGSPPPQQRPPLQPQQQPSQRWGPPPRQPPPPVASPAPPSATPLPQHWHPAALGRRSSGGVSSAAPEVRPRPSVYLGDRGALGRAMRKQELGVAPSTNFNDIHHLIRRGDSVNAATACWADCLRSSHHAADSSARGRPPRREAWCGRLKRDVGWADIRESDRRRREEVWQHQRQRAHRLDDTEFAGAWHPDDSRLSGAPQRRAASRSSSAPPPPRGPLGDAQHGGAPRGAWGGPPEVGTPRARGQLAQQMARLV